MIFTHGNTTQTVDKSSQVTYNGIDMLLVEGTFINEYKQTTTAYSAIYLLTGENGKYPVYIIGIPIKDGIDVSDTIKSIAENITKQ